MEDLFIKMTTQTPEINFKLNGDFSIKGVSIPENTFAFYRDAMAWLEQLDTSRLTTVKLDLDFEYLNTASTRSVIELIKLIIKFRRKDMEPKFNWHYEAEDEDALELGQDIEFCVDASFLFSPKTAEN